MRWSTTLTMIWVPLLAICVDLLGTSAAVAREPEPTNYRRPKNDDELRYWLGNMIWHHRFTTEEAAGATGLSADDVVAAAKRLGITAKNRPKREADAPLKVLPYPGGRHPRIGFLDGAVRPQRETKVSVFTPWNEDDYVVVDVPEAIWHQHGLLYLAHTHVPTVWTKQKIELEPLEWNRRQDGTLDIERKLPNGVFFAAKVTPGKDGVRMKLTLTNGSKEKLSDLRVQNCVMLKMAAGFNAQTNDNKIYGKPYVACRSADAPKDKEARLLKEAGLRGKRYVITAWEPCHRAWANAPCPCLHSDPKFPDCEPGATKSLHGWLSFYEGDDVKAEFRRLDTIGWQKD